MTGKRWGAAILLLGLLYTAGPSTALASKMEPHGNGCACPESAPGWVVYPDTARGAPDFFRKSSIQVQEVVLCDNGVHFLFRAKQGGEERRVCIVMAVRSFEERMYRLPADSIPSDANLEQIVHQLEWEQVVFGERIKSLREILQASMGRRDRATFKTGWLRRAPRLRLGPPLELRYKNRTVELFGVPDVYFQAMGDE